MKKIILIFAFLFSIQCIPAMNTPVKTETIIEHATTINKLMTVGVFLDIDPIFSAVFKNEKPNFIILIQQSKCINKRDFSGKTPLENALQEDQIHYKDIVELLQAAGAQKQ